MFIVHLAHEIGASMPNVRRFFFTMLGCVCVAMLIGGANPPATGDASAVHNLKVKLEREKQTTVEGEAKFHSFRIQSNYGQLEVDLSKAHTLGIDRVEGDKVFASVEMTDHSRHSGELYTKELPVELDGKTEKLKLEENLKVTFLHPKKTGLVALLVGLLTLSVMEIVLGIDNVIFLAIVAGKLPEPQQPLARRIGLGVALGTRILLLFTLSLLMAATKPLFIMPELPFLVGPEARGISIRDLVLVAGGLFLIYKSVKEIHEKVEHADSKETKPKKAVTFGMVIFQIALIDIIFSLDSVITAVGMVEELWVMITAMVVAAGVMVAFADPISNFVEKNPSIKVLALSFLILIGALLVAEGFGQHIDKGYIYSAMAFAVIIEFINMRLRPKPVADSIDVASPS
jgi:predicted tellurium resistance membrane protein TerC